MVIYTFYLIREEYLSEDIFWNRMSFIYTLNKANDFAILMGDKELAQKYK